MDRATVTLRTGPLRRIGATLAAAACGLALALVPQAAGAELTTVAFSSVVAGIDNTCAISTAGALWCWGYDSYGQLLDGNTTPSDVPVDLSTSSALSGVLSGDTVAQVVTGDGTTCILTKVSETAYCWGENNLGQMGDGTRNPYTTTPTAVAFPGTFTGHVTELAGGLFTSFCALTSTSQVWCWGSRGGEDLGDGNSASSGNVDTPVQVVDTGVLAGVTLTSIAGGSEIYCVVSSSGAAYCWGDGADGALGNDTEGPSDEPVSVSTSSMPAGSAFLSVEPSYTHTCAIVLASAAKSVWCWGENVDGVLGLGDTIDGSEPGGQIDESDTAQRVTALNSDGVTQVTASPFQSCALSSAGQLYCWGDDPIGDGNDAGTVDSPELLAHGDLYSRTLTDIASGDYVNCAVDSQSSLYCWGEDGSGQVGDGTEITSTSPEEIAAAPGATPIDTVPNTPRSVTGDAGNAQITASWQVPYDDGGQAISGYTAEAIDTSETESPATCTVSASTFTCPITGLINGDYYDISVEATNSNGNSLWSGGDNNPLEPTSVPVPPVLIEAQGADEQAYVAWDTPTNDGGLPITGYIATATDTSETETPQTCVAEAGTDDCTIEDLINGDDYSVTVVATNNNGNSEPSNALTAIVGVPEAPASANATAGDQQIAVTWTASPDAGGAPITKYVATAKAGSTTVDCTTDQNGTGCTIAPLDNGTTYDVTVVAVNSIGASAPYDAGDFVPVTDPDAPTLVSAIGENESISVGWTPGASNGGSPVSSFTATATGPGGDWQCTGGASDTTCTIIGLTNGTSYSVSVVETTGFGTSANSNSLSATPANVPDAPTLDSAVAGNQQIAVTWTGSGVDNGSAVTGYTATASAGGVDVTCDGGSSDTGCTITGLTNGTTYTVTVTENNGQGDSSPSNSKTATPVTTPDAPTLVTAVGAHDAIVATWHAGASNGGSVVEHFIATATYDGVNSTCEVTPATGTTCTITGLVDGRTYSVSVTETTAVGTSNPSNSLSATAEAPPTAPGGPTVTVATGRLTVSWTAPTDDGGFTVSGYTVTATPGNQSCTTTTALSCTVTGLSTATSYTVSVVAANSVGKGPAATASGIFAYATSAFSVNVGAKVVLANVSFSAVASGIAPKTKVTFTLKGAPTLSCVADTYHQCAVSYKLSPGIEHLSAKEASKTVALTFYAPGISVPTSVEKGAKLSVHLVDCPPKQVVSVALSDGRKFTTRAAANGAVAWSIPMTKTGTVTLTFTIALVAIPTIYKVTVT